MKSAKSEGGCLSEMDSSDGAQKQVQMTVRKKKKRQAALIDATMYQALLDQLDKTTLEAQRSQINTISALDQAMTEIRALRAQVESLQASQGSLAGNLDLTTSRVATCEITLHQHGQQLQDVQQRQATMTSQWDAFQQKWKEDGTRTGNQQQEAGHATDFFLGGIPQLRQSLGLSPHSDPVEVVATMLKTLSLYCSVDRIFVADNAAQNRGG
jgi:chromosome segregation ATPase